MYTCLVGVSVTAELLGSEDERLVVKLVWGGMFSSTTFISLRTAVEMLAAVL